MATSETVDEYGEPVLSEIPVMTLWASIEPIAELQLREVLAATQTQQEITHRITIRHLDGLDARNRIVFGSRTFEILSVASVDERNHKMQLLCKERI